jgi:phospholipid/cholesterol/gamma-HCH transport system substrate-binding protein
MKISHARLPHIRLAVVIAFAAACAAFWGYLWLGAGGQLPLLSDDGYRVSAEFPHVSNVVPGSHVRVGGVKVGHVVDVVSRQGEATVTMQLDDGPRPLHEGTTVRVRSKTLLGEGFLEVVDGKGDPLPDGAQLPKGAGSAAVDPNDVLNSLDAKTRDALAQSIQSLGGATKDTRRSLAAGLNGLGDISREGSDALSALAAQSGELRELTGDTTRLLNALDTRQGQIAQLVSDADQVTRVTAGHRKRIAAVVRELPGLVRAAGGASDDVSRLSGALRPIARDVRTAAPKLSSALRRLPGTATDLRALLPSLDGVLDRAPATLRKVPTAGRDLRRIIPPVDAALRDVNPMLAYLAPYDREAVAFFTNFGQVFNTENGVLKLIVVPTDKTVRGKPAGNLLTKNIPYPAPGSAMDPRPSFDTYPRIREEK